MTIIRRTLAEIMAPTAAPAPQEPTPAQTNIVLNISNERQLDETVSVVTAAASEGTVYDLKKLFAFEPMTGSTMTLDLGEYDSIPDIDNAYVFDQELTNAVLLYLKYPLKDCLWIAGPAGTGKTTTVLQTAARLKWGVQQITASSKTESLDLIGHINMVNGSLVYQYGPLAHALKYGEILLINEIDTMPPSDLSALNDVLEGKPLTIPQNNNEIIKPHKNFRLIVTGNTTGMGDDTGMYMGTKAMNQAFLDRFRFVITNYPSAEFKTQILKKAYNANDFVCQQVIALDTEIAKTYNLGLESGVMQLSAPFTIRSLLKVGGLMCVAGINMRTAVMLAYANRLPAAEREFVVRVVNDIMGHVPLQETEKPARKTRSKKAAA